MKNYFTYVPYTQVTVGYMKASLVNNIPHHIEDLYQAKYTNEKTIIYI